MLPPDRSWPETNTLPPLIGGVATMPSRAHTFRIAVANILPQIDRLYVFFDRHDSVPQEFADHPKIIGLLPSQFGQVKGAGKLLGLRLHAEPCIYFCFDDDILYPPTYVEVLTRALYRHHLRAIVGLHGTLFRAPHSSYSRDRAVLHFSKAQLVDAHVDELGTGTVAFHSKSFAVDPRRWPFFDMIDLMVAIDAVKQHVPRIVIRRPQGFLTALEQNQADSIHLRLLKDDSRQSRIMRDALGAYPLSWHLAP